MNRDFINKLSIGSFWMFMLVCVIIFPLLGQTPPSHTVDLDSLVGYSQESLIWSGPGAAETIVKGYPNPPGPCNNLTQEDLWSAIESNRVEVDWYTDPVGLKMAMQNLCTPIAPGSWGVFSHANPTQVMYKTAYWMTKNNYPVAVLLDTEPNYNEEHWVVIKKIVTDKNPVDYPSIQLQYVEYIDPAPVLFGYPAEYHMVSSQEWYSNFKKVDKTNSAYFQKHVAVWQSSYLQFLPVLQPYHQHLS